MIAMYWKQILGGVVAVGLLLALTVSWYTRGQRVDALQEWQDTVVLTVTEATVAPDKNGGKKALDTAAVVPAITGLVWSRDSAFAALDNTSKIAAADKALSDSLDAKLKEAQADLARQAAKSEATIAALKARRPTGDASKDCAAMAEDSAAAWKGWK